MYVLPALQPKNYLSTHLSTACGEDAPTMFGPSTISSQESEPLSSSSGKSGRPPVKSEGECIEPRRFSSRVAKPRQSRRWTATATTRELNGTKACRVPRPARSGQPFVMVSRFWSCSVFRDHPRVFASCRACDGLGTPRPRMSPFHQCDGCITSPTRGTSHETHISTQPTSQEAQARLPVAHAHPSGTINRQAASLEGPPRTLRIARCSFLSDPRQISWPCIEREPAVERADCS